MIICLLNIFFSTKILEQGDLHDEGPVSTISSSNLCRPPEGVVEDSFLTPESVWPSSRSQEVVVVEQGEDILLAFFSIFS